jgi:hypothetical protein
MTNPKRKLLHGWGYGIEAINTRYSQGEERKKMFRFCRSDHHKQSDV